MIAGMKRQWFVQARSFHLVLAVLLLLAQMVLLVHATKHVLAPEEEAACTICATLGHSNPVLPVDEAGSFSFGFGVDAIAVPLISLFLALAVLAPRPRSPPLPR